MNTLELKNIYFEYKDNKVFNDLSIKIEKGHNVSIIGGLSSGKTTLTKIFNNKLNYKGSYLINGVEIVKSNSYVVDRFVNVIYKNDDIDDEKVVDVLFDLFNNDEAEVKKAAKYFGINSYLDYKISELSNELKYYILIINNLFKVDSFLIIDDLLCYLNNNQVDKIYKFAKRNKITVINISSNLDDVLYSDYVIFLYNNNIAMEGDIKSCLKEEKLLKRLGYRLPFMYDLSLQLNYYDVIDDIYLDYAKMESAIWK